ncbi:hypothetical protein AVBRAN12640_07585 [Campylobacter sp. RM12640]|uniref:hypothetical protein n=1 Tax=unclassified Campylobacter TaxID=2593542 RepID=UPI003014CFD6|nr:hypothetical protein [Campylobacter sp. RM12637]MBZ7982394.1 hypothetical protein [Campylobacter sp. RM12640]MBZ7989577.1 hypothetical protein [Campylobacter sp. RM12635]
MAVPFILGGIALATGAFGAKKGYDGYRNKSEANKLNKDAEFIYNHASERLNNSRKKANNSLEILGQAKIHIHENSFSEFIDIFTKIKNIESNDFSKDDLKFDIEDFVAFTKESIINFKELAGGGIASLGAGALAGVGAYGSVGLLASASTGTAIASLSGAAATNATLAWLGGGSLAAGGFGMAGGMVVLGGIVAAPVLAVGGALFAKASEKALEDAKSNIKQAEIAEEQMETARISTDAISSIIEQSLVIINQLDEKLVKELQTLKLIVIRESDYTKYSDGEKEYLKFIVNMVKAISGICKVNVLTVDGKVNKEFRRAVEDAQDLGEEILSK